jgi:uncharacterized membrane protein
MVTINKEQMEQLKRVYADYFVAQGMEYTAKQLEQNEVFYSVILRDNNTHTLFTLNGTH